MVIVADGSAEEKLQSFAEKMTEDLRKEYSGTDGDITVAFRKCGEGELAVLDTVSKEKVCFFLMNVPNGIQKMSGEIEGLVETSTNLGIIKLGPSVLYGSSSVRSSVGSGKDALTDRIRYVTEFLGSRRRAHIRRGSIRRIPGCAI